jgi:hypothetical protein
MDALLVTDEEEGLRHLLLQKSKREEEGSSITL